MLPHGLSLAEEYYLLFGGQSLLGYLNDLNARGYIAAMYLADEITQATYTGTFAGTILRNAAYTSGPGATLVANGTFAADTDWTKGTGWTIGSGVASCDGTQVANSDLSQAAVLTSTNTILVEFTISGYSAGTLTPLCGTQAGTGRTANGSYSEYIIANGTGFALRADANFVGSVDNVVVRKVGQLDAAIGGTTPWLAAGGLSFDGLTSYAKVLNNVALYNLTTFEWMFDVRPDTTGESGVGGFWFWNGTIPRGRLNSALTSIAVGHPYSTSPESTVATISAIPTTKHSLLFMSHRAATKLSYVHTGQSGVLAEASYGTHTAGVGTFTTPSALDLYIGNDSTFVTTFDGDVRKVVLFNQELTDAQRQNLISLAGV